jgi:hypothetical protein
MAASSVPPAWPKISKRAARRLIQRALVLVGRDRNVRQHLREAHLSMLWVLEDWEFQWTVVLDRGKIDFDRRPTRKPDVVLSWREAAAFFQAVDSGVVREGDASVECPPELRRVADRVIQAFRFKLGEVLRFPFDDAGVRIA